MSIILSIPICVFKWISTGLTSLNRRPLACSLDATARQATLPKTAATLARSPVGVRRWLGLVAPSPGQQIEGFEGGGLKNRDEFCIFERAHSANLR